MESGRQTGDGGEGHSEELFGNNLRSGMTAPCMFPWKWFLGRGELGQASMQQGPKV